MPIDMIRSGLMTIRLQFVVVIRCMVQVSMQVPACTTKSQEVAWNRGYNYDS